MAGLAGGLRAAGAQKPLRWSDAERRRAERHLIRTARRTAGSPRYKIADSSTTRGTMAIEIRRRFLDRLIC